ncbi:MAG: SAM-dependent methyltransferase [Ruminococcaceae bacterium]|nr:SAM-dependent methyltransferase [Oscillospiraceae bacterium]
MTSINLGPRLSAAAELVRHGAYVCDVGTDHAYLPISLCLAGKARGGVVSDINEGPIQRAKENINKYGLAGKLTAIRTDGLNGIDIYRPEDIMILGMGGELIARILADAPWTKQGDVQLCLQPMTHPELLRSFLLENGYSIIDERLATEERIYQIILARYTGKTEKWSDEELLLGKINIQRGGTALCELAKRHRNTLLRRAEGIESSGADASEQRELIEKLQKITAQGE